MLTLITPTGDRPEAFSLCEYWMANQTYIHDVQWIVVDDGKEPTCTTSDQLYIRREPTDKDPSHTLAINLKTALPHVKGDRILIIEDDDYYAPQYLQAMTWWLDQADLVGERGARYYFLRDRAYYYWADHKHASLCRTGFTRKVLPVLSGVLDRIKPGDWRIDLNLWESFQGEKKLVETDEDSPALCVGIKQIPGREGITHRKYPRSKPDANLKQLKKWIGNDIRAYDRFIPVPSKDLPVYTCLFGDYDKLAPPHGTNCHVVTDNPRSVPEGWHITEADRSFSTPKEASRYYKINSHLLFPDSPSLYLDANIILRKPAQVLAAHLHSMSPESAVCLFRHNRSQTISDEVKEVIRIRFADRDQVDTEVTRNNKDLPVGWGGCLLRKNTDSVREFNEIWWDLYQEGHTRDQVVLPVALRKSGVTWTMLDEPIPFYGEKSDWMSVRPHQKKRQKV